MITTPDASSFSRTCVLTSTDCISTVDPKFGAGNFSQTGENYCAVGSPESLAFTGDFTIHFWVRYSEYTSGMLGSTVFESLSITPLNVLDFYISNSEERATLIWFGMNDEGGGEMYMSLIPTLSLGEWYHIAVVCKDDTLSCFVNGAKQVFDGMSVGFDRGFTPSSFAIGVGQTAFMAGELDEFCISDVARWTEDFTPPSRAYTSGGGITSLGNAQDFLREGYRNNYVMHIVGDGPVTVTSNPPIVAGVQGTILTLVGTSDVNTVTFTSLGNLSLVSPITLKSGTVLTVVYDADASVWREASRS